MLGVQQSEFNIPHTNIRSEHNIASSYSAPLRNLPFSVILLYPNQLIYFLSEYRQLWRGVRKRSSYIHHAHGRINT